MAQSVAISTQESIETDKLVHHPGHYISKTGMEVIDVVEAFTADLVGIEATDTGNVIKYICRWSQKDGIRDLKKAAWYINHLIQHLEKKQSVPAILQKQFQIPADDKAA
jgi:hypothetical protein